MFTGISLKQITINDRSQGLPTHRFFLLFHFLQESLRAVSRLRLVCLVWTLGAPAGLRVAAVDTRNTKQQPAHTNGGTFKLNIATHLQEHFGRLFFSKNTFSYWQKKLHLTFLTPYLSMFSSSHLPLSLLRAVCPQYEPPLHLTCEMLKDFL